MKIVCLRHLPYLHLCVSGVTLYFLIGGPVWATPPQSEDLLIEKVVMLMRHGVRASLVSEELARYSTHPWPTLDGAAGEVGAHGKAAMTLWGQYQRRRLADQGLLPPGRPLNAEQLIVFSAPSQRARASAEAFLEGLSACDGLEMVRAQTRPWFALPMGGLSHANPAHLKQAVSNALGMPLDAARVKYLPAMQVVEHQLGIPSGRLSQQPWELTLNAAGARISPLWLFNQIVETVRMQYAANLPMQDVGFGSVVHQAGLADLMALRGVNHTAIKHPRYIAVRSCAALLPQLAESLSSQLGGFLFVYVGYDTNVSSIRSVLGFDWEMPEHLLNDVGPGGMLMFERLCDARSGERFVRVSYHAQTSDQIRYLQPLGDSAPPFSAVFAPPPSLLSPGANLIPLRSFKALVDRVVAEAHESTLTSSPRPTPQITSQITPRVNGEWMHGVAHLPITDQLVGPFSR